jgi:hypothetical protein
MLEEMEDLPSQTAAHHTFVIAQEPSQCTPSIWSSPMMTLLRLPPSLTMKTASESPPSAWPVQDTPRPYVFMPPSKVVTSIGSVRVSEPVDAGMGSEARFEREEKFIGDGLAGPAAATAAKAMMAAATEAFMLTVESVKGLVLEVEMENELSGGGTRRRMECVKQV